MKEFENNIVISFRLNGETIRQRIDADRVKRGRGEWTFVFYHRGLRLRVVGDIDSDGDFRTDGPLDKTGRAARFFVETPVAGYRIVDDVDIVATDVPMQSGRMYITVQIDYEYEKPEDPDKEAQFDADFRQDIMSECRYSFSLPDGFKGRITDTQILGEND